jgi:DNA polymerase-3 subunit delta
MSLQLLKSDIETHNFHRIYYLCGEEAYLQHYYFNELKKALFGDATDHPDCIIKDSNEIELPDFTDEISSFPIFSEYKAVIIKDLKLSDEITEWLINHSDEIEDSTVIIVYQITESIDLKTDTAKQLKKAVSDHGLWVDIAPLDPQTLYKWVSQQFRKRNKSIDSHTLTYFISSTSTEMYSLLNEIEKLSAYCDDTITADAIDRITVKTIDAKTYELTNAVFDKNPGKAFSILKTLSDMRTNEMLIMASIYSSVTTLYKTKLLLDSGLSAPEIASELGQKEYPVKKNIARVKAKRAELLEKMLNICLETDMNSKTTSSDTGAMLSELIMTLIELL